MHSEVIPGPTGEPALIVALTLEDLRMISAGGQLSADIEAPPLVVKKVIVASPGEADSLLNSMAAEDKATVVLIVMPPDVCAQAAKRYGVFTSYGSRGLVTVITITPSDAAVKGVLRLCKAYNENMDAGRQLIRRAIEAPPSLN